MFSSLFKSKPASQAPRRGAHARPHATPDERAKPVARPAAQKVSIPGLDLDVVNKYSDLQEIATVLSAGERPIVNLAQEQRKTMVVVEHLSPRGVVVIVDQNNVDTHHILAVHGMLQGASKTILETRRATPEIIKAIYETAAARIDSKGGMRRSQNAAMAEVSRWVEYAVKQRATDIHIQIKGQSGIVKFRVDGELEESRAENKGRYSAELLKSAMSGLFNLESQSGSNSGSMFEDSKMQYCMIDYKEVKDKPLKLRYQSFKGSTGPKNVLRLLETDDSAPTLTFKQLGYADSHIALWEIAQATHSGIVAIAGITGSGKTTTNKTFIELNPDLDSLCVYSIEDPVEYPLKGTHQIPLQRSSTDAKQSTEAFLEAIHAIMRGDPDMVVVGEVRDMDSANALMQIAESGHAAIATTHTHLITGIVPRWCNEKIGLTRQVLCAPNILTLLVYQALVPRLCEEPGCAHTTEQIRLIDPRACTYADQLEELGLDSSRFRWKNPSGCPACGGRGTRGQTVVAEMLIPTDEWLDATRRGLDEQAMETYRATSNNDLASPDMTGKTVLEHTLYKALQGQVDPRQCSRFDVFPRFVAKHKARMAKIKGGSSA